MRLLTAGEMREVDRHTIAGGHASGAQLMARAGQSVVDAMVRRYGSLLGLRVLVVCGRGNNGGDGFVAASALKTAGAVTCVGVAGDPAGIRGDARAHFEDMRAAGIDAVAFEDEPALVKLVGRHDAWDFAIDALLGTGATGDPRGPVAAAVQVLRELDARGTRVVAVDLPTGLDADTGALARRAVRADLTVTFGAPKRGHWLFPGRAFVGTLEVADIGLVMPEALHAAVPELATERAMAALVPLREPRAHKGSVGRVLAIGGSAGLTGAITLAAKAAMRAGAGYLWMAIPASLHDVIEIKLTEAITLTMPETPARSLAAPALEALITRANEADAVILGPGLGREAETLQLARDLPTRFSRPCVIDADALYAFAGKASDLARLTAPRVLTPHLGELAGITGVASAALEARRIDAAREHAAHLDAVLVMKGAPTVTAAPDGRATVNATGNPGLATMGTGDVLAGIIAALMAQGLSPYDAARLGVWIHGAAGDRAAVRLGVHGMIAGDLLDEVPGAIRRLVERRESARPPQNENARADGRGR